MVVLLEDIVLGEISKCFLQLTQAGDVPAGNSVVLKKLGDLCYSQLLYHVTGSFSYLLSRESCGQLPGLLNL